MGNGRPNPAPPAVREVRLTRPSDRAVATTGLGEAAFRLGAVYRAYERLRSRLSVEIKLPADVDTPFFVVLADVYAPRSDLWALQAGYAGDVDVVAPAAMSAARSWLAAALSAHRRDLRELKAAMLGPEVLASLVRTAQAYQDVINRPVKQVPLDIPVTALPPDMPPGTQILVDDPAEARQREQEALAVVDSSYMRILYTHPERRSIFIALAKGESQGREKVSQVVDDAVSGIQQFGASIAEDPERIWRYSPVLVGAVQTLGLGRDEDFTRFMLSLGRLKAGNAWGTALTVAGIAIAAAGLVATGPAALILLAADAALSGTTAYQGFVRERENDFARSASALRAGEPFTDRPSQYGGVVLDGAMALLTALQLARGGLQAARPSVARTEAALETSGPVASEARVDDRLTSQPSVESDAAIPLESVQETMTRETREAHPKWLERPEGAAEASGQRPRGLQQSPSRVTADRPRRQLASGETGRRREVQRHRTLEKQGIEPTRAAPLPTRRQRPITRPEQLFGIPLDPIYRARMRGKTPSEGMREWARAQFRIGDPDPALPGRFFDATAEADHIVSMERIRQFDGFAELTEEAQLIVLNWKENFIAMSRSANASKGAKSFFEWTRHGELGIAIDSVFLERIQARELDLVPRIQEKIYELLKEQQAAADAWSATRVAK